jgi:hypothetical protein
LPNFNGSQGSFERKMTIPKPQMDQISWKI